MPGAAPEGPAHAPDKAPLTAEQFNAWKQQQDAKAAQVLLCFVSQTPPQARRKAKPQACASAALGFSIYVVALSLFSLLASPPESRPLCPEQLQPVQERAAAAAQRKADILVGHVAPNGTRVVPVTLCPLACFLWNCEARGERAGRELYELHPELFEDY